jgi:hypothetical protein
LLLGLQGTAKLDAKWNMLTALDHYVAKIGVTYNSVVLRKAFRSLIFEDVRRCQWEKLTSTTFQTIFDRCAEVNDDPVDFKHFLHISCSQQMMRLVKSASLKAKENSSFQTH